jgi:hypothetical protein
VYIKYIFVDAESSNNNLHLYGTFAVLEFT